jgi:diphthamide biosynthesis methyltransferase
MYFKDIIPYIQTEAREMPPALALSILIMLTAVYNQNVLEDLMDFVLDRRLGGSQELVWTQTLEEKSFTSAEDRTLVVQSVVRHYTD